MPAPRNALKYSLKKLYDWLDLLAVNKKPSVVSLTPVTTANAADLATAIALANANKAKINQMITALKADDQ